MRRLIFWGTILSGVAAAYLMYRRGESLGTIASRAVTDPVGTFSSELKTTLS